MGRVYIGAAAEILDRREGTIRKWEREGKLPDHLVPKRDERNWRYWDEDVLEEVKRWMVEEDMRPGKGLPYASRPTENQIAEHLQNLRRPRKKKTDN